MAINWARCKDAHAFGKHVAAASGHVLIAKKEGLDSAVFIERIYPLMIGHAAALGLTGAVPGHNELLQYPDVWVATLLPLVERALKDAQDGSYEAYEVGITEGSISYFLRLFCCDCSSTLCRYRSKTRSKAPLYLAHRSASI